VVEGVEETRYGIERLLAAGGYQVSTARDEEDAIQKASFHHPDWILISLSLDAVQVLPFAGRIREHAGLARKLQSWSSASQA
jgi:CheY-like chemotaxis protein